METLPNTEVKKKSNKVLIAIIVLVAVVLAFIYLNKQQRIQVPKDFILSQTNLEKIYQESNNAAFSRYTINQSPEEIYNFFKAKLQKDKWTIEVDRGLQNENGSERASLYSSKGKYSSNVYINKDKSVETTTVEITFFASR